MWGVGGCGSFLEEGFRVLLVGSGVCEKRKGGRWRHERQDRISQDEKGRRWRRSRRMYEVGVDESWMNTLFGRKKGKNR